MEADGKYPRSEETHALGEVMRSLVDDPGFRSSFDADPARALAEKGVRLRPGVETRLSEDTDKIVHFIMPPDPNVELADEALTTVAGGKTTGSFGSVGTVICSTGPSCAATISSVGSVDTEAS